MKSMTAKTYLSAWRGFNKFLLCLDHKPEHWEERISLYIAYLVDNGTQSSTIKSYFSAIKKLLWSDNYYKLDENRILRNTLTSACKLINDRAHTWLPAHIDLLEILMFEFEGMFKTQHYLEILYKTIFLIGYYGLLRIAEMTMSPHTLKAKKCSYWGQQRQDTTHSILIQNTWCQ